MRAVVHLLGPSSGGIRRHVRYLAANPPSGYRTAGIVGPEDSAAYFDGFAFAAGRHRRAWRSFHPDILHAHGLSAGARAVSETILRNKNGRPGLVITVHTSMRQTLLSSVPGARFSMVQQGLWALGKAAIARADAVISVSREVAEQVPGSLVIPPALDLAVADPSSRQKTRKMLGTPSDRVVVLAVARLHPDKALETFVEAVARSDAEGWLAGDGPERARLEQLARGTGVRLLGQRDDVGSLLAAADIFALPAFAEAYGFAVLEAVAAGLPVVATRTGAIAETVGDAGLLVDPGDAVSFVEAVKRLVDSPELRNDLAQRSRKRVLPPAHELIGRLGEIYDRVCSSKTKPSLS